MHVVHIASEVAPFSKTGGLADVLGTLPRALARIGVEVSVVSPHYPSVSSGTPAPRHVADVRVSLEDRTRQVGLLEAVGQGVRHVFISAPEAYARPGIYGDASGDYPDNPARFALLNRAALSALDVLAIPADVIHCHDWQAGPTPWLLARRQEQESRPRSVFTIHNLGYQGSFATETSRLFGADPACSGAVEHNGRFSFLKAGLVHADLLTTVSPTYAREICDSEMGFGFDELLRTRSGSLVGILNGIDRDAWNPTRDPALASPYGPGDLRGKRTCREALCRRLGLLSTTSPLFGVVSRLAGQKGIDLLLEAAPTLIDLPGLLVVVGTGEVRLHRELEQLQRSHPGRVAVFLGFDEGLARQVYAGADFFLMPSRYEPCGLGQLIAMRYGTLPIGARTGGLADTIRDVDEDPDRGNGWLFPRGALDGFKHKLQSASKLFGQPVALETARRRAMEEDFSWDARARDYLGLYRRVLASAVT